VPTGVDASCLHRRGIPSAASRALRWWQAAQNRRSITMPTSERDTMKTLFARIASQSAYWMGHYAAFTLATLVCVIWAVSGPFFGFSDTWQLVINTGTTVLTFLAVFLIQNSQNRESKAIQLKLDELIRAVGEANDRLIDVEETDDDELDALKELYRHQAQRVRPNGTEPLIKASGGKGNAAI
jgi:low affinity Fe/Cu permease